VLAVRVFFNDEYFHGVVIQCIGWSPFRMSEVLGGVTWDLGHSFSREDVKLIIPCLSEETWIDSCGSKASGGPGPDIHNLFQTSYDVIVRYLLTYKGRRDR
jgi:hypothetical protein